MALDISVVIPTFNQKPRYLSEAIESALNQSYPKNKYEILVVDDGSTKIPPDPIVQPFKQKGVILIKKSHGGPAHTMNAGIRHMKGKYFKWLSSDDTMSEDALELLMSKADEKSIIYGDVIKNILRCDFFKRQRNEKIPLAWLFRRWFCYNHSKMCFRKGWHV